MMFFGLFWLIALLLVVRWMFPPDDSRRLASAEVERLNAELARLRDEVDRLGGQVERLQDEQSFLLRLLEAGEPPRPLAGPPENDR